MPVIVLRQCFSGTLVRQLPTATLPLVDLDLTWQIFVPSAAAPIGAPRTRPHSNMHTLSYVSSFSSKTIPHPLQTSQNSQPRDPFYGHEKTARICACFITHWFALPENPPSSGTSISPIHCKLPFFIAYTLQPHKIHSAVTYAALVFFQWLKARFPTARGSSGHRLTISAFMIASKSAMTPILGQLLLRQRSPHGR